MVAGQYSGRGAAPKVCFFPPSIGSPRSSTAHRHPLMARGLVVAGDGGRLQEWFDGVGAEVIKRLNKRGEKGGWYTFDSQVPCAPCPCLACTAMRWL